ncbi:NAD-dependent epimerase/dehydratase family protein [Aciditerrimonas ferrireducens]|uniref:NAD-dependent epimerase/dehydratase family protein n=1 Tax=Aciditerrimonas ferrireducens TaxID=667306 RepID=UPI002004491B|nr:NAD-dependent epimerase/dehydratase family protein [Aciditerrimonas ferrireducens]MCK4176395.1 NAD-dependent epimerase/dehydratase family protein [Aciditerrimonas ferrireducens]
MGRRILVTGIDTFWGGRMAQALEQDPEVELVLGLGRTPPRVRLERAEVVRTDQAYTLLSRIVRATQVDTVVHTFLVVDSTKASGRALHEINVIGTLNLLAACSQPEAAVRQVVVKSSTLVYGASPRDPAWFDEDHPRVAQAATRLERSLLEVEGLVRDFAEDNPGIVVSVLRFANVLGPNITTPLSTGLARRLAPVIGGFDPLLQFVEEHDVVRALAHATTERLPGTYNVAGAGKVPWREVLATCGALPLRLPPLGTQLAAAPLVRLGVLEFPPELDALLRYGRGVDGRRFEATGFRYTATTAGAVERFARALRLRRSVGQEPPGYTYEQDVEEFFRRSPAVVVRPEGVPAGPARSHQR